MHSSNDKSNIDSLIDFCTFILLIQVLTLALVIRLDNKISELPAVEPSEPQSTAQPSETTMPTEIDISDPTASTELTEPPEPSEQPATEPTETKPETPATIPSEPTEAPTRYYDVPLSEDLQDHIFKLCETHGIDPAIVISIIERESDYRPKLVGDNGASFGLMQIQPKWHQNRMDKLDCQDLFNPFHNVSVGIDYLADLYDRGKPLEWILMAYNGGPSYANRKWAAGEISKYAKGVIEFSKTLEFKD